ncbi:MAG TPA: DUF4097 family beta strand repeat-containing protein [Gemmatimonadales bacterium]|jgi:hypothetical protein|nr:DUF4097 family beta strand repeat-containing protein [Gemmatimonadales bacterium]
MPSSRSCLPVIAAALLTLPALLPAQQAAGTYRVAGSHFAVYNLAGSVSVVAGSGDELTVGVTAQGADAAGLRVATGELRGRQTFRVIFPEGDIVYPGLGAHSETQLQVRDDGTFDDSDGRGRDVRIRGSGSGTRASADLEVGLPAGRSLDLYLAAGEVSVRNVKGNLSVDVGSASVDVDGLAGDFTLDAGSAPVRLAHIKGGTLSLDTGSGTIAATDVSATAISLDSGSGDVTLDGVSSTDLSLDTGSGDVTLRLNTDIDQLMLDSGSGSVTIYVPPDLGAELDVDGGSGDIDVQLPLLNRSSDEDDDSLRGTLGDGHGRITIDSGSGDVRILKR